MIFLEISQLLKNSHTYVNDYGIVSEKLYPEIEKFIFLPQTTFSDHSEIVISIKNILVPKIDGDQEEWHPLEKRGTWDIDSLSSMRKNLENTSDVQLNNVTSLVQSENIPEASRALINIIENATTHLNKAPKKPHSTQTFPHKRRKKKQKAWFDTDLQEIKEKYK